MPGPLFWFVFLSWSCVVVKGDGTIGSVLQWIMADLHVSGIEPILRRYIIDAMTFHRNKRYFFSERQIRFSLTTNHNNYAPGDGFGLPSDLVEIASRTIWILVGGNTNSRFACVRASTDEQEQSLIGWGNSAAQPTTWDYRNGALRFVPVPSSSADVAELRYLTNIGIPRISWDPTAGGFAFYHPTTGENITSTIDNWANDWTSQEAGATAIRMRAMYSVQKNYLRDMEGANDTLAGWLEAVAQLEDETESKTAGVQYLEGSILD